MAKKIMVDTKSQTITATTLAVAAAKPVEHKPYQRTYWVNHYVDESGHIIQQGTPLDQDHFNNIEEGIVDHDTHLQEVDATLQSVPEAIESAKKNVTETLRQEVDALGLARARLYSCTLTVEGWVEREGGGYQQTVACEGLTKNTTGGPLFRLPVFDPEIDEPADENLALIKGGESQSDSAVFICPEEKPEMALEIYFWGVG